MTSRDDAADELRRRQFAALREAVAASGGAAAAGAAAIDRECYRGLALLAATSAALFEACGTTWRRNGALEARP